MNAYYLCDEYCPASPIVIKGTVDNPIKMKLIIQRQFFTELMRRMSKEGFACSRLRRSDGPYHEAVFEIADPHKEVKA